MYEGYIYIAATVPFVYERTSHYTDMCLQFMFDILSEASRQVDNIQDKFKERLKEPTEEGGKIDSCFSLVLMSKIKETKGE